MFTRGTFMYFPLLHKIEKSKIFSSFIPLSAMKLLSRLLIFSLLIAFVASQVLDPGMFNRVCGGSKTKLRASQSRLANAVFNFAAATRNHSKTPAVSSSNKKVGAAASQKFQTAVIELADIATELGSLDAIEPFVNASIDCYEMNAKITEIEMDAWRYAALAVHAKTNSTLLKSHVTTVSNYAKAETPPANVKNITSQNMGVQSKYGDFIKTLFESIRAEAAAKANYENYRRGMCVCRAESEIKASKGIAGHLKTITDVRTSVKTNQASIKSAITAANPKITAAIALNISEMANHDLNQLMAHFKRVSSNAEMETSLTAPTSCREMLDISGRAFFVKWFGLQDGIISKRNASITAKRLGEEKNYFDIFLLKINFYS